MITPITGCATVKNIHFQEVDVVMSNKLQLTVIEIAIVDGRIMTSCLKHLFDFVFHIAVYARIDVSSLDVKMF